MIVGLGMDIAEVDRVRGAIGRQGERFLKRLYTAKERAYLRQLLDRNHLEDEPVAQRVQRKHKA